jgi:hypothetical protein
MTGRASPAGNILIDNPMLLGLIVLIIIFPLVLVFTASMRFAYLLNVANGAAASASRCRSFQFDAPPDMSMINTAQAEVRQKLANYGGLTMDDCTVFVIQEPIGSAEKAMQFNSSLRFAPDGGHNLYLVAVVIKGQLDPLLKDNKSCDMPLITSPIPVMVKGTHAVEHLEALLK